jgi:hypothetical protein
MHPDVIEAATVEFDPPYSHRPAERRARRVLAAQAKPEAILEEAAKVADAYADGQDKVVRASVIARAIRRAALSTQEKPQ